MDATTTPLESNLSWTVSWHDASRDFIGKKPLKTKKKSGCPTSFGWLGISVRGVLRQGQTVVLNDGREGTITSGGFSPSSERSIAMARLPKGTDTEACVEIRGKLLPVRIVNLPFYKNGSFTAL